MLPEIGSSVYVQSFKHDGSLHRTWCKAYILEADEQRIVAVTDRAWVIEADGRKWVTREPAVCFFYSKKWYNIITMLRHSGIYYYCNMASPSLFDGEAIKNIDYDLDIKLYPDRGYQILDENEFAEHMRKMNYPEVIEKILRKSMDDLINEMDLANDPFTQGDIERYYRIYQDMTWAQEPGYDRKNS